MIQIRKNISIIVYFGNQVGVTITPEILFCAKIHVRNKSALRSFASQVSIKLYDTNVLTMHVQNHISLTI